MLLGAGLAGAYLHAVPNVQPLDLVVLCSGLLLGVREGAAIGGLAMLVYSLLNPYGVAHPLITLSQVVGEAGYGVGGGVLARLGLERRPWWGRALAMLLAALILTLLFDLITNLATALLFGLKPMESGRSADAAARVRAFRALMLGGLPFAIVHVGVNAALFTGAGAPLAAVLARYRERLSH